MSSTYDIWLDQVREALHSVNMEMGDWQPIFAFDFSAAHDAGDTPDEAAMKANKFWWYRQNQSLKTDCRRTPRCWLPQSHRGGCQPLYERGDYLKVEFPDDTTGIGEWMWLRVRRCDDNKQLAFGILDNEPVNEYDDKLELGSELAVAYSQIRGHKRPTEFTKQ